ncbi:MAG: hypothetical protein JKY82_02705 [Rhizobiaceae bacterium]|nr:hypothetical protein [Rhizobiaceae bacterium]
MTVALAFYKGKGNFLDRAIRLVTGSQYSHVEYIQNVEDIDPEGCHECWSSSPRDGGVRNKRIALIQSHWDVVKIDFLKTDRRYLFEWKIVGGYDYLGIILNHFFAFHRQHHKRWFCSEIIAFAIGIPNSEIYSPGTLKELVEEVNEIVSRKYADGIDVGKKIGLKNV